MLRNKQEEKLKELRRVDVRMNELDPYGVEYVVVKKPFFIGWDIYITLSESGARRRDANKLIQVLNILGTTKPIFAKSVKLIKFLRKFRYSVSTIDELCVGTYSYKNTLFPYAFKRLSEFYITMHKYENVPADLKHYFYKSQINYWAVDSIKNTCYKLCASSFPTYELVYKVEKSYATHLGIPKGDDRSEHDFLRDKLNNAHYWCSKNFGSSYGHRIGIEDNDRRRHRRHWNDFCKRIMQTDFSYEIEEELQKPFNNKKIHF